MKVSQVWLLLQSSFNTFSRNQPNSSLSALLNMEELQFVVEQLNAEPFNLSIRAVELEQKSNSELLHLLVHIISIVDDGLEVHPSVESEDVVADKITQFLATHKCKLRLTDESNDTPISILYWLLQNHDYLKQRCYLSRFLLPIVVPEEYLHESDSNLGELLESVRDLQAEFIERHKEFERARSSSGPSPTALKQEINKLVKEKQQLKERLQREQNLMRGNDKIKALLKETRHLRQSEDDEIKLLSQREDQLERASVAKQRLEQVQHLSGILRVLKESASIDQMDTSVVDYERKLVELELKMHRSCNSSTDTVQMEDAVLALEDELERKLSELDKVTQHGLDLNKLRTFRQVSWSVHFISSWLYLYSLSHSPIIVSTSMLPVQSCTRHNKNLSQKRQTRALQPHIYSQHFIETSLRRAMSNLNNSVPICPAKRTYFIRLRRKLKPLKKRMPN